MSTLAARRAFVLAFAFALSCAAPVLVVAAPAGTTVLAKVNGKEITEEDLELAAQDLGPNVPQQLQGKARDAYLLDYLIDGQLVAQKALAEKLDKAPDFPAKLAYFREKLLMEALLTQVAKSSVTDAAMKQVYDDAAKAQKPQTEIHARHILVATKAEAEAALKRIKAGEDFAKVAKEVSKDAGDNGGDLGWFTKDRMIPAFADAAFKLQPGQVSEPVQTQFGWHIIQVEGKRQTTFPPFDQVKDQVAHFVEQRAQSELIAQLRKGAKIERFDDAPNPPPGAPAPSKK